MDLYSVWYFVMTYMGNLEILYITIIFTSVAIEEI